MKKVPETKMARAYRLVTAYRSKWPEATINEACKAVKVDKHAYANYLNSEHYAKIKHQKRVNEAMKEFDEIVMTPPKPSFAIANEVARAQPSDILSVAGRLSEALREVTRLKHELKELL